MPASSASCPRRILLSQELTQRSGTFVTDIPPEQFGEKKPNFNLLLFRMGDCFRPMKPQSKPVAGFYAIDNLRIMPENSNCSNLVDDKPRGRLAVRGTNMVRVRVCLQACRKCCVMRAPSDAERRCRWRMSKANPAARRRSR